MHSDYLSGAFNVDLRRFTVSVLVRYLQPRFYNEDFTHIYVRGVSGLTVGSMVAYELDAPMMVLRKADSHGDAPMEGLTTNAKCCIIDDLVCSGDTIAAMQDALYDGAKLVGLCLYNAHERRFQIPLDFIQKIHWLTFHCKAAYTDASCYGMASPEELARIYTQMREEQHAVS